MKTVSIFIAESIGFGIILDIGMAFLLNEIAEVMLISTHGK
jgi:hypothetical protein